MRKAPISWIKEKISLKTSIEVFRSLAGALREEYKTCVGAASRAMPITSGRAV